MWGYWDILLYVQLQRGEFGDIVELYSGNKFWFVGVLNHGRYPDVNWRKGLPRATQTYTVGEPLTGMAYSTQTEANVPVN